MSLALEIPRTCRLQLLANCPPGLRHNNRSNPCVEAGKRRLELAQYSTLPGKLVPVALSLGSRT